MKILIHTCCADCLLKITNSLKDEVVAYFYNPNIHPRAEYLARLKAIQKITKDYNIKLIVPDWSPKEWFKTNPSKSPFDKGDFIKPNRCEKCWNLRLNKTFEYAKKNDFEAVTTTLLSSHYQNKEIIEKIGKDLEKEYKIKFLVPNKINRELKTSGFYKQNYCGCAYSLVENWENKFRTI